MPDRAPGLAVDSCTNHMRDFTKGDVGAHVFQLSAFIALTTFFQTLYLVLDVVIVLVVGSLVTWLVVPQPRGAGTVSRRSPWSAALGLFAAVPISYLVLVVVTQILEPLLG